MTIDTLFDVLAKVWEFLTVGCMEFLDLLNGTLSDVIRSIDLLFVDDVLAWITEFFGFGSWQVSHFLFASVGLVFIVRPIISAFRAML